MVKTRFAPSPTGAMHVGNVRTALFAWLWARHGGGKFVLRIEDTDLERSLPEHTDRLMRDLRWLGLDWDEGPGVGGPAGPYLQSERLDTYREHAGRLVAEGKAYHCFCTPEEIEAGQARMAAEGKPPHYDGRCRNLTAGQREEKVRSGLRPAVRFLAYDEDFAFTDHVRGRVEFPRGMVGDFIIVRSTGLPVYNYAVTLDDALMGITHVLRADEHLSNTVRQLMLYRALGFPAPEFAHMSLVLGPDRQKLSKRHGATSLGEFRELGYLPEALVNYLALLGWSHPEEKELLTMDELVAAFDLDRLSPSPAIFDPQKLDWAAKHWLHQADLDRVVELARPHVLASGVADEAWLADPGNRDLFRGAVGIARGYCSHLSQIGDHLVPLLREDYPVSDEARALLSQETAPKALAAFRDAFAAHEGPLDGEAYDALARGVMAATGLKGKHLFIPLRAALTGQSKGPELHAVVPLLGRDRVLARLKRFL